MCECRYVHLCPSGHLPFRAPAPKNSKIFPSPPLPKNQKFLTALPTPFSPLSNPSHLFIRRPPARQELVWTASTGVPGDHGSAIPGRGVVTGDHGADRQGRVVWRGVEGVGRGSPCDGVMSVPVSRDSPGGRWEGVTRGGEGVGREVPHVTGSGLDSISVIPPPRPWIDPPGEMGGEKCREKKFLDRPGRVVTAVSIS